MNEITRYYIKLYFACLHKYGFKVHIYQLSNKHNFTNNSESNKHNFTNDSAVTVSSLSMQLVLHNGPDMTKCLVQALPKLNPLTLWRPLGFGNFQKKRLNAHGFALEFLRSGMLERPGKSLKRRSNLLVCTRKNNFLHGGGFVSDIISGGLLGHLDSLFLALGANR